MQNGTQIIAEGLVFPEGPVVMADGSVIVVETDAGRVTRCWNGRKETICEPGGGANGGAIGPDGAYTSAITVAWDPATRPYPAPSAGSSGWILQPAAISRCLSSAASAA